MDKEAGYQLDLLGGSGGYRVRSRATAGEVQARSVVLLTLIAAADYFQLLGLDLQLQIVLDTIRNQMESARFTQRPEEKTLSAKNKWDVPIRRCPDESDDAYDCCNMVDRVLYGFSA